MGRVPYQLLAGLAGALIEADLRPADVAAFVVHAFESDALDRERVTANNDGFGRFVGLIGDRGDPLGLGELLGPLSVPGGEGIPTRPLFVGMAVTQLAVDRGVDTRVV